MNPSTEANSSPSSTNGDRGKFDNARPRQSSDVLEMFRRDAEFMARFLLVSLTAAPMIPRTLRGGSRSADAGGMMDPK